jgi:hypothetical protein
MVECLWPSTAKENHRWDWTVAEKKRCFRNLNDVIVEGEKRGRG